MLVELTDGVVVEVVPGQPLPWTPRFEIRDSTVKVGPYRNAAEHESHFLDTVGSGEWHKPDHDELRFDRHDGRLVSLWFHVPGRRAIDEFTDDWADLPSVAAEVRLTGDRQAQFRLEPMDRRWLDERGEVLISSRSRVLERPGERFLWQVADGLDLLVSDGRLVGWQLRNVERLLATGDAAGALDPPDEDLAGWVKEYLDIVGQRGETPFEFDPQVEALLRELDGRIDLGRGAVGRRRALHECIDDVVDFFYD